MMLTETPVASVANVDGLARRRGSERAFAARSVRPCRSPACAHRAATRRAPAGEVDVLAPRRAFHPHEALPEPARPRRRAPTRRRCPARAPRRDERGERVAERGLVGRPRSASPAELGSSPIDAALRNSFCTYSSDGSPGVMPSTSDVVALLGLLDLLPVRDDRVGVSRRCDVAEHVRMAVHELVVHVPRATSAIVNAPASAASTEWIITWNSRSPSSSSSASYAPSGDVAAGRVGRELRRSPPRPRTPLRARGGASE